VANTERSHGKTDEYHDNTERYCGVNKKKFAIVLRDIEVYPKLKVYQGNKPHNTEGLPHNIRGLPHNTEGMLKNTVKYHEITRYPVVFFGFPWCFEGSQGITQYHTVSLRYHTGINGFVDFDLCNFVFVFNFVQKGLSYTLQIS